MALNKNEIAILLSLKDEASAGVSRFGSTAAKTLAGVAVAAAIAGGAVAQAMDFEDAIADLSAITGAVGDDLDFLSEKSREFGKTTTLSAVQSAEAFKLVASAKPELLENKEALAEVTEQTILLAEASGTLLPAAAKTVGSSLNQFSADADEAARFVNVLAAGAKYGASEIVDSSAALAQFGTVASDAGLSFEETNALIQMNAAVAIKGAKAGTGLRGVILKLTTQTRDEFNPALVGTAQALKNLAAAELTATEKKKLFGEESITSANALIKEADNFEKLVEKITATNVASEQASVKTNTLTNDLKKLGNATTDRAIGLGKSLTPALRDVVQGTTAFISDTDSLLSLLPELGTIVSVVGIKMAATAVSSGAMATGFVTVATTVKALTKSLLPLAAALGVVEIVKLGNVAWEAWNARLEASESRARGAAAAQDAYNKILIPAKDRLRELGIELDKTDPTNVNMVNDALRILNADTRVNLPPVAAAVRDIGTAADESREKTTQFLADMAIETKAYEESIQRTFDSLGIGVSESMAETYMDAARTFDEFVNSNALSKDELQLLWNELVQSAQAMGADISDEFLRMAEAKGLSTGEMIRHGEKTKAALAKEAKAWSNTFKHMVTSGNFTKAALQRVLNDVIRAYQAAGKAVPESVKRMAIAIELSTKAMNAARPSAWRMSIASWQKLLEARPRLQKRTRNRCEQPQARSAWAGRWATS